MECLHIEAKSIWKKSSKDHCKIT